MKMSVQITLFLVCFNAFGGLLVATGVAGDLGINVQQQGNQVVERATVEEPDLGSGNGLQNTLFGMYNTLTQQVSDIMWAITPGFQMLKAYVPDMWIDFVLYPVSSIIVGKDMIAFARGTDL